MGYSVVLKILRFLSYSVLLSIFYFYFLGKGGASPPLSFYRFKKARRHLHLRRKRSLHKMGNPLLKMKSRQKTIIYPATKNLNKETKQIAP